MTVEKEFNVLMKKAAEEHVATLKVDPRRVFMLRASSLPYCGLRRLLDFRHQDLEQNTMDFAAWYYVSVGSAVHHVFQNLLGSTGSFIGNWKCPKCKDVKKFTSFSFCTKCKWPRQYEELSVRHRKLYSGHIDGLFKDSQGRYWVIDYKTTSSGSIYIHSKKKIYPYKANVCQIQSYVPLVEKQYGIKVAGYMLIYLSRDSPFKTNGKVLVSHLMSAKEKRDVLESLDRDVKIFKRMLKAKQEADLKFMIKYRLCPTKEFYRENVHSPYHSCDYARHCFSTKGIEKFALSVLDSDTYPMVNHMPKPLREKLL